MRPGSIALTEDLNDLAGSVRALVARHVPADVVRAALRPSDTATGHGEAERPVFWSALAEAGLLGLHLPEELGGADCGITEVAVVLEELGRGMVPGPFLPTVLTSAVLHRAAHLAHLPSLASGEAVGAVALESAIVGRRATGDSLVLDGQAAVVLGADAATVLVLPVVVDGAGRWVVVSRELVEVEPLPSLDGTRRLAQVRLRSVSVQAADILDVDPELPLHLAAVLFAAEASGIAEWATATASEYAQVRQQFGRPIGQFQGVKHRCARMLSRSEQARACAWDAAQALDSQAPDAEVFLAASVAGATSLEAAYGNAKDCIQTLGGIGFTWEHDAHLYLRRAETLRMLLGPTSRWYRRVATAVLDGTRRRLSVELPPEAEQVRSAVRAELAPALDLEGAEQRAYLADHGYTAPHLPTPWGRGADAVGQLVIAEELGAAGLHPVDLVIGAWVVPTLIAYGGEAQQRRFLGPTLRGEITWCQLFSEPGAGSDLAGLSTRAEKVEGGWSVRGQKVWTSMARTADYGILLARTDQSAPKHKGLSYFILDMASPGVDVRPLRELTGEALFNEVFLDEVFIPDDMLVASPGEGWKLARTTLANERVSLSSDSALGSGGEALVELARSGAVESDPDRLPRLGKILCDAQSGGLLGLRRTVRALGGGQPGPESSITKLIGVEHIQEVWETAVEWTGVTGLLEDPGSLDGAAKIADRSPMWRFLNSRCLSIAGGTTDVQLNIVGERVLGLPRDPEPESRVPVTSGAAAVSTSKQEA